MAMSLLSMELHGPCMVLRGKAIAKTPGYIYTSVKENCSGIFLKVPNLFQSSTLKLNDIFYSRNEIEVEFSLVKNLLE